MAYEHPESCLWLLCPRLEPQPPLRQRRLWNSEVSNHTRAATSYYQKPHFFKVDKTLKVVSSCEEI